MMTVKSDILADRIRPILGVGPGITEKKMFGGAGFMLDGNMIVGAMSTGELLARVDRDKHKEAKTRPGASAMVMGDREMVGFIMVDGDGIETDEDLEGWINFCLDYVKTLPPKDAKPVKKATKPVSKAALRFARVEKPAAKPPVTKAAPKKPAAKTAAPKPAAKKAPPKAATKAPAKKPAAKPAKKAAARKR
jgi:TfoX/Sxy family transcriptional regulator of competence genes